MQTSREPGSENSPAANHHPQRIAFAHICVILTAAAVAVTPLAIRGSSCGSDFHFHLSSWIDAQKAWRHGIAYPHWAWGPNFGAGEPRFVFYPPLVWMLGAALGLLLPWTLVPLAITYLLLAATGLATRTLALQFLGKFPDNRFATLAGCAAIFSGYALYTAYERAAFAELSGGFWIPLLLLFALREGTPANRSAKAKVFRQAFDGSCLPLALVVAGAWLSNAPLGVMVSYLLAAVAIASALLSRSWVPLARAAIAAPLGIAATAVYLIPAAWEQRWVAIAHAIQDPGTRIEENWLFERLNNPVFWWHDPELWKASVIAVVMIAITLACAFIAYRRGALDTPSRRRWIPLALIPIAVLFLLLPISLPAWNALPRLRFLQFPWRWLVTLEAPMAIFLAAAVASLRPAWRRAAIAFWVAFFLLSTAVAARSFFIPCSSASYLTAMLANFESGQGMRGVPEYLPPNADTALLTPAMPVSCLITDPAASLKDLACDQEFSLSAHGGRNGLEHISVTGTASHPGYLVLHILSYPAWQITINGHAVDSLPPRGDGLIAVSVPQGPITVDIDWTTTPDVIIGRWVSCAALVLLAALWLMERRLAHAHLSALIYHGHNVF